MKKTERFIGACSKYIDKVGWATDIPVDQIKEKGYVKVENDSVVLDRHEHQKYCAYKIIEPQIKGCLDRETKLEKRLAVKENDIGKLESEIDDLKYELKQARKRTAKEILSLAIKHDNGYETDMTRFISDLKKQFGVEE